MKHVKQFDDFLKNHVNLNGTRLEILTERVPAVTGLLKRNYPRYKKYSEQGSYAHKTIIKPVKGNDEFDADILVYVDGSDFSPDSFTDYIDQIYQVLKEDGKYKDKIRRKSRCVMINYAGDFHLDVVPCIEHDGKYYICNRAEGEYEETDGEGYKEWLQKKNDIVGNNYFRKTVRLLKFLRDHKDNFSVESILLTTLLGERVDPLGSPDCFTDLPTTLKTLSNRLNSFLQANPRMPTVNNPALRKEDFTRHWDENKYRNFREKFDIYNTKINDAYDEQDSEESIKKWRKLFGDDFGDKQSNKKGTKSAATIGTVVPTVSATKPYASVADPLPLISTCRVPGFLEDRKIYPRSYVTSMIEYTPEALKAAQKWFPNLRYDEETNNIKGTLDIKARYTQKRKKKPWLITPCECNDNECIQDSYKIEICLSDRVEGIPKVFETEGRIKRLAEEMGKPYADLHLNRDGSCCLSLRTNPDISLESFMLYRVYPYFVWQAYFAKHKKVPPCGEYPHDINKAKAELRDEKKHLGRNDLCWCGSGKKYKKCCLDKVEGIIGLRHTR